MIETSNKYFETSYEKWYKFSQCSNNQKSLIKLIRLIKFKKQQKGFELKSVIENNETLFYISENYNPCVLQLSESKLNHFLGYLHSLYPTNEFLEEDEEIVAINNDIKNPIIRNKSYQNKTVDNAGHKDNTSFLKNLAGRLASKYYARHSFNFSLVSFIFIQPVILPGNIGYSSLGSFGKYLFFTITFMIVFLGVRVYSKEISTIKSAREIFSLTILHNIFFFLLIVFEVEIIDFFRGSFDMFFFIFLIVLGQVAGLVLSLIQSGIIYFLRGGKLIVFEEKEPFNTTK